jgi:hypothetical protein
MVSICAEKRLVHVPCFVPICTFMVVQVGLAPDPMMAPPARITQVREGNFPTEIPDGISAAAIARYRTACQGDVEYAGFTPVFGWGRTRFSATFLIADPSAS